MAEITTNASVDGEKVGITVDYNIGDTIEAAIAEFGEDCVYGLYARGATLAVQQKIGQMLRAGMSPDEAGDKIANFRLDQRGVRTKKSAGDKARELLSGMDADQIKAVLEGLGLKVK
tara:strand:- start:123 stop:473 length:351 start_codon:yes stop_codon:yes gene_type:complete